MYTICRKTTKKVVEKYALIFSNAWKIPLKSLLYLEISTGGFSKKNSEYVTKKRPKKDLALEFFYK